MLLHSATPEKPESVRHVTEEEPNTMPRTSSSAPEDMTTCNQEFEEETYQRLPSLNVATRLGTSVAGLSDNQGTRPW
jgi:hypothetical protein